MGSAPIVITAGSGICLSGEEKGCPKVYDNVGLDVLFGLKNEALSLAVHGGVDALSFDALTLQLRAGLLGRLSIGKNLTLAFDPRILVGLTERDFNKEAVDLPAWLWFDISTTLSVYLHSGISAPFDGFADSFAIPVQAGASFKVSEKLTVGGDFSFPNLLGKGSSSDSRTLGIRAAFAI
ncbi:MAG: hypothetical protein WKG01_05550 [Kofleriaceae bacterium]